MTQPRPAASESRPSVAVQVIVAIVGLVGVLGGAVLANWDKLFPKQIGTATSAAPVASSGATTQSSTGAQSPVVSGVGGNVTINIGATAPTGKHDAGEAQAVQQAWLGTWQSALTPSVYDGKRFRLRLHFERFGSDLIGTAVEIDPSGKEYPPRTLHELRIQADVATFQTRGTVTSGDQEVPYTERYQLRRQGASIKASRENDAPGGGEIELFTLEALDAKVGKPGQAIARNPAQ